jgi:hypothetical protein
VEEEMPSETILEDFVTAMEELGDIVKSFKFSGKALLADIVLMGFISDVWECALSVHQLSQTEFPHRAFPLIRTAFEATQQSMVLVTQENYTEAGIKACLYFLNKDRQWLAQAKPEDSGITSSDDADKWFIQKAEDFSIICNKIEENSGDTLRQMASDIISTKPKRGPDNWLGENIPNAQSLALKKIVSSLNLGLDDLQIKAYIDINKSLYSRLSRETHTGLRLDSKITVSKSSDGAIDARIAPRNPEKNRDSVLVSAYNSVVEASWILRYRLKLQSNLL